MGVFQAGPVTAPVASFVPEAWVKFPAMPCVSVLENPRDFHKQDRALFPFNSTVQGEVPPHPMVFQMRAVNNYEFESVPAPSRDLLRMSSYSCKPV